MAGRLLRAGARRDSGLSLAIALFLVAWVLVAILALTDIASNCNIAAYRQVQRSQALSAATAGIERSKYDLAYTTMVTDRSPINLSQSLLTGRFDLSLTPQSSTVTYPFLVNIVSVGTSGNGRCTVRRTASLDRDNTKLRIVNYVTSIVTGPWSPGDKQYPVHYTPLVERSPLQTAGVPELPDMTWWRTNATYVLSGRSTWTLPHDDPNVSSVDHALLLPGIHFYNGNVRITGQTKLTGTIVVTGDLDVNRDFLCTSADWTVPAIICLGNIYFRAGNNSIVQGAIYCGGNFDMNNGQINGRVICAGSASISNGDITGNANDVYQFLNHFFYNPQGAGYLVQQIGWIEES